MKVNKYVQLGYVRVESATRYVVTIRIYFVAVRELTAANCVRIVLVFSFQIKNVESLFIQGSAN